MHSSVNSLRLITCPTEAHRGGALTDPGIDVDAISLLCQQSHHVVLSPAPAEHVLRIRLARQRPIQRSSYSYSQLLSLASTQVVSSKEPA